MVFCMYACVHVLEYRYAYVAINSLPYAWNE